MEHFRDIEERQNVILASIGDLIATVEREQIQEFIDVSECGLALETLAGAFEAGTSALPHSAFKDMDGSPK